MGSNGADKKGGKAKGPAGRIRPAGIEDLGDIQALVEAAYAIYLPRMPNPPGWPPGPMLDDYSARIRLGQAFVYDESRGSKPGEALGLLVLIGTQGEAGGEAGGEAALLLDNVAVAEKVRGKGIGGKLIAFAEAEARRRGFAAIELYTHETMTENVALYEKLGYAVTGRGEQAGYSRVFMRKELG